MKKLFFTYLLLMVALGAEAGVVDFNAASSSVEGQYLKSGRFATGLTSGFTGYLNDDDVRYFSINLQSQLEALPNSGVVLGLGAKFFLLYQPLETGDAADDANLGLAVQLQSGYRFIINDFPAQVVLSVEHSPNIINDGGLNTLTRANLRSELRLTDSVITYLGYRNGRALHNHENIDLAETYDSSLILGFRLRF